MIDIFKFKIFLKQNINYFQIKKKKRHFLTTFLNLKVLLKLRKLDNFEIKYKIKVAFY